MWVQHRPRFQVQMSLRGQAHPFAVTFGTVCGRHLESHLSQLAEDFRVWAATQASLILKELE